MKTLRDMTAGETTRPGIEPETRELLARSLRELFAAHSDSAAVTAALAELGWDEVREAAPEDATTLLFTEQGRALATSRALDEILLGELAAVLPTISGSRAVLYPHPDEDGPVPGLSGVLLGPLDGVDEVVAPVTAADGGAEVLIIPAGRIAEAAVPVTGFDPRSGWLTLTGFTPGDVLPVRAGDAWRRGQAAAHRALATEITGVCEQALAMATAHTSARQQYGRLIGSFQAVRHRLAEAHVALAAARTAVEAAWTAAGDSHGGAWAARVAKLRAGRAQVEVFRHSLQVFGAMGLTRESDLHRYATRAAALDALLGDHASLAEATGNELLAGAVPQRVVEI